MIQEATYKEPLISFGYGFTDITVTTGTTVTMWLDSLYNDGFAILLNYSGATLISISDYQHEFTYGSTGTYTIQVVVSNPEKTKNIVSNTLTVTVI